MSLENQDFKVVLPTGTPPCTWEDVERFQCNLLSEKLRKEYGNALNTKYGKVMTERLLHPDNVRTTHYLLSNPPHLPATERYTPRTHGLTKLGDLLKPLA